MEASSKGKRGKWIALTAVGLVVVAGVVACLCIFLPRSFYKRLPDQKLTRVEMEVMVEISDVNPAGKQKYVLSSEQLESFGSELKKLKFTVQRQPCKCMSSEEIYLYYEDGSTVTFSGFGVGVKDPSGEFTWSEKIILTPYDEIVEFIKRNPA